tara:strand:+ start:1764 stop:3668 length:1905 start_codon:yes stop_codon:yes gene_type:complete
MKIKSLLLLFFISTVFSQISLSDVREMSNEQLDLIKEELSKQNSAAGINNTDFEENELTTVKVIASDNPDNDNPFFGYEYFQKDISFFDNVPVPRDFILGPGDEVVISVWGETNFRKSFTLNREGLIFYENLGFLNLSNKTISESQKYLKNEFSKIFSTLKEDDNRSNLLLEVGQLKSINVYFTGNVTNPGIHLIHPLSDLFSAFVQAGGINQNGSLRNIKILRENKEIMSVDFYNFFLSGINNFDSLRLIDGDIIHVPTVSKRAKIEGQVINTGFFELLDNETVSDLIKFAGGYTKDASQSAVLNLIIPIAERSSDDNALTSVNLDAKNYQSVKLNNGDSINILSIPNVESKVEILGRVKNPGMYSFNSTLKEVLDLAGGFNDPIFRQTINEDNIVILRKDAKSFYGEVITISYDSSQDFALNPEDKILVYEDINYRNNYTYRVEGEVLQPGTYPLTLGITLGKAIELAGGLTILSTKENIIVSQEFTTIDEFDNKVISTIKVANVNSDFELGANSVITALPFENVISVEGNVYNPGLVAYNRGITMYQAIEQAGGYKPFSLKNKSYVKRANGEIDKANLFLGRIKRLKPGDTVVVPLDPDPDEFDITTFISDLSSTLANIAAILLIVDNQND